jgi:succinate dehydrogenase flavin-adding protein (antitoxin of CptAB toxin-antitoxin module)
MKELDLMLARWVHARFDQASPIARRQFRSLLELPDPELIRYLLGGEEPDSPEVAAAVSDVRASNQLMSGQAWNSASPRPL